MIKTSNTVVAERVVEAFAPAPTHDKPKKAGSTPRTRRKLALLLGILATAMLAAGYHYFSRRAAAPVAPVAEVRPPAVVGLGYLEPSSTVVKIGAPGSPDALKIGSLLVAEGDEVAAGQVLAVLDTAAKLAAQVKQSEAQVQLKQLQLERQRLEITYTIASRHAALERARANLDSSKAEFGRQQSLVDRNVATLANLEKKKMDFLNAQATVREMEAAIARIQAASEIAIPSRPRTVIDIAVTEQELASAEADLNVARANLELATIRAPFAGRVLTLKTRGGERFSNDGLLELGATQSMRAVVEVYQSDIWRIRIGQAASIRAEVLGQPISGTIERISATVKRQSVVNNDPATATDARVIEVFVALDEAASRKVAVLSRLQVQVVFEP